MEGVGVCTLTDGNSSHGDYPYLVMAEAQGQTFKRAFHQLLGRGGWGAVFKVAQQIASALDAVHKCELIHRDVKPLNIIINVEDEKGTLLDFGIVRMKDSSQTAEGTRIGSSGFSAPEQIAGPPVFASDQWSLAACFYFVLTALRPGARPGDESNPNRLELGVELDQRIYNGEVTPFRDVRKIVDVPDCVVDAITKALAHEPADRFSSVMEFVRAMEMGISDATAPVLPDEGTEAALRQWLQVSEGDMDTPILLTPSADKPHSPAPLPALLATLEETPPALGSITEEVSRPATQRSFVAPAIVASLVLAAAAYMLWGRAAGPSSVASAREIAPSQKQELTPVEQPIAIAPTSVEARIVATFDDVPVDGLVVQVGESSPTTPATLPMPIGSSIVTVTDSRFAGIYTCVVSAVSPACEVDLVRVPVETARTGSSNRGKRGKSSKGRKLPEDEKSMFNKFDKPLPEGEKSMFNKFDKKVSP